MKIAFLFNVSPRWGNPIPALIFQIKKNVETEKEFFVVDRNQPNSIENHLDQISKNSFDRIAVFGGDGTLNRIINHLKNKNAIDQFSFMILPFGTCNDFAKTAGFRTLRFRKRKVAAALRSLTKNTFREVRIVRVNHHYFINNAGFGRRNPAGKRKSLIADLAAMQAVQTKIQWDASDMDGSFLMMLCANAPYFSSGLHFSKDCDASDDMLDFFFVKNVNKIGLLTKLFLGKRGFPLSRSKTTVQIRTSQLSLKTDSPVWIMADGEVVPSLSAIREAVFEIAGTCRFILPQ